MIDPAQQQFQYEQELNQQKIDAEREMSAPAIMQQQQQVQAAIVEQTNPSHILEEIELKLKGYKMNWDGSLKRVSEPLMNNRGIGRMLFILSSVVNQNTILSHLQDDEIGRLIVRVSDDIIDDLVLNWKEYDIQDKILLDYIVDVVLIPSFLALKRAWRQNEKNWLNRVVLESINSSPRQPVQKKASFFDRFKL